MEASDGQAGEREEPLEQVKWGWACGGEERRALQGLAWEGREDECQGRRGGEIGEVPQLVRD